MKTFESEIDCTDRKLAKEYGSTYVHYNKLRVRASNLASEINSNIEKLFINPEDTYMLDGQDIYRMENLNQLLSIVLAESQTEVPTIQAINEFIKANRENDAKLKKEFGE